MSLFMIFKLISISFNTLAKQLKLWDSKQCLVFIRKWSKWVKNWDDAVSFSFGKSFHHNTIFYNSCCTVCSTTLVCQL